VWAGVAGGFSWTGEGTKVGAGVTAGAGVLFRIDELASVGVEYNLVKNLVERDPELHRLMITAKIRLW